MAVALIMDRRKGIEHENIWKSCGAGLPGIAFGHYCWLVPFDELVILDVVIPDAVQHAMLLCWSGI